MKDDKKVKEVSRGFKENKKDMPLPTQHQEVFPSHDIYDMSGMYGMQPIPQNGMPLPIQDIDMCPSPEMYQMPGTYVMPQQFQAPQMYTSPMICCPVLKQMQCPLMMGNHGMYGSGGMMMPW